MLWRRALLASLMAFTLIGSVNAQGVGQKRQVSGWLVASFHDGGTRLCQTFRETDQAFLTFQMDRNGRVGIGLKNPSWRLGADKTAYTFKVEIDDRFHREYDAIGKGDRIATGLEQPHGLIAAARRGYKMRIVAEHRTFAFDLDGTYEALAEMQDCVRRRGAWGTDDRAPQRSHNPFDDGGSGAADTQHVDRAALRKLKGLLQTAGVRDPDPAPPSGDAGALAKQAAAVWQAADGDVRGMAFGVKPNAPDDIIDGFVRSLATDCTGAFSTSAAETRRNRETRAVARARNATCRTADANVRFGVVVLDHPDGRPVMLVHLSDTDTGRRMVDALTARIVDVAITRKSQI